MSNKKGSKSICVAITLMIICIIGIVAIFIWDLVVRIRRGWTNNDTIVLVFFVMIAMSGPVVFKSFHDYFVNHNREVIILNNNIYRLFINMEKNGTICNYEKQLINQENKKHLEKINKIIQKKQIEMTITFDNIEEHFSSTYGFYKGDANTLDSYKLSSLYNKIKANKSISYEKLYRSVHGGDLIKTKKFPLFEFVIPLLIGFAGIFSTIYQTLAVDGSIQEPLIDYFKFFGSMIIFALAYTLFTYRPFKEGIINSKSNLLAELELFK